MQTKQIVVGLVVLVVIALVAGIYLMGNTAPVAVASGDNISVYYTLALTNGTVLQSNFGQQPLTFTAGSNELIQGFNQAILGMTVNQTKNVTIPANEAYGPVNPSLFVQVPLSAFGNSTVEPGMTVTQTVSSTGQQYQGIITGVNETNATVDFNPPLAGQILHFTIRVVHIQKS